nr:hypothetical protein [Gemmatimonadaceae bacterium]
MTERSIADGRVRLLGAVDAPGVSAWAPIAHRHAVPAAATITLATTAWPLRTAGASRPRDLAWGDLHAWVEHPAASVVMHAGPAAAPRLVGTADLTRGTATVTVPHAAAVADVAGALLLASGILLAQHGHLLMHAGAIVAPTGEAWLLVGDTHSGKSTTVATLIAAGWRWVADDTVVVTADATGTLTAAGWVRQPHLD